MFSDCAYLIQIPSLIEIFILLIEKNNYSLTFLKCLLALYYSYNKHDCLLIHRDFYTWFQFLDWKWNRLLILFFENALMIFGKILGSYQLQTLIVALKLSHAVAAHIYGAFPYFAFVSMALMYFNKMPSVPFWLL